MTGRASGMGKLYATWGAVAAIVLVLAASSRRESTQLYGIAETGEVQVNSEVAVEIAAVQVVEGQWVRRGAPLVELRDPQLTLRINQLTHRLEALRARHGADDASIRAQIDQLRAEMRAHASATTERIRQLRARQSLNQALTSGLKSLELGELGTSSETSIALQIEGLTRQAKLAAHPLAIQIKRLELQLRTQADPTEIQAERLEKELALLRAKSRALNIAAPIDGIVSAVHFKRGANVAPFVPIVTLHPKTPSLIKAYVHENQHTRIKTGMKVTVASVADRGNTAEGIVVGLGARIVEYPQRLRQRPDLPTWGRELVVRLPSTNSFVLGEKTVVSNGAGSASGWQQTASARVRPMIRSHRHDTNHRQFHAVPIEPLRFRRIEASAVLFLADLDRYLVISDDTPDDQPLLFLVDRHGRVTDEPRIKGLEKVDDLEGLTSDRAGRLYVAASQSHTHRGKLPARRRLLLRLERSGGSFRLEASIDLYKALSQAAKTAPADQPWATFLRDAIRQRTLDIEGIVWHQGGLLLAVKSPLRAGKSAILKLDKIDQVLRQQRIGSEDKALVLWKEVDLRPGVKAPQQRLSDLHICGAALYLTGASKTGGSLWRAPLRSGTLEHVTDFGQLRPEGVTCGPDAKHLLVVFDQGSSRFSRMARVQVD